MPWMIETYDRPGSGDLRLRLIANETLEEGIVWLRHKVERTHDAA